MSAPSDKDPPHNPYQSPHKKWGRGPHSSFYVGPLPKSPVPGARPQPAAAPPAPAASPLLDPNLIVTAPIPASPAAAAARRAFGGVSSGSVHPGTGIRTTPAPAQPREPVLGPPMSMNSGSAPPRLSPASFAADAPARTLADPAAASPPPAPAANPFAPARSSLPMGLSAPGAEVRQPEADLAATWTPRPPRPRRASPLAGRTPLVVGGALAALAVIAGVVVLTNRRPPQPEVAAAPAAAQPAPTVAPATPAPAVPVLVPQSSASPPPSRAASASAQPPAQLQRPTAAAARRPAPSATRPPAADLAPAPAAVMPTPSQPTPQLIQPPAPSAASAPVLTVPPAAVQPPAANPPADPDAPVVTRPRDF
jgi:hypothetical protein